MGLFYSGPLSGDGWVVAPAEVRPKALSDTLSWGLCISLNVSN